MSWSYSLAKSLERRQENGVSLSVPSPGTFFVGDTSDDILNESAVSATPSDVPAGNGSPMFAVTSILECLTHLRRLTLLGTEAANCLGHLGLAHTVESEAAGRELVQELNRVPRLRVAPRPISSGLFGWA